MKKTLCVLCCLSLHFCGFAASSKSKLTNIHIIDRHGITETISTKDRLSQYEKIDFLSPQPYQKVTRVFPRDKYGRMKSVMTSYHPNGQCHQYLEVLNQRACGSYREWFNNGQLKLDCTVTGGLADLTPQAEKSWLFEGPVFVWTDEGNLLAEFQYKHGQLNGISKYYHTNENLWKTVPYEKNLVHGTQVFYLEDGSTLETTYFVQGKKEGSSIRYWKNGKTASQEIYDNGRLTEGVYTLPSDEVVSKVENGCGFRSIFGKDRVIEKREYAHGIEDGTVSIFNEDGSLLRIFTIKDNEKQGEDITYMQSQGKALPKLLITRSDGKIHGQVKTWYDNGFLESQKDFSQNEKSGISIAWYPDGALMLVEEYDKDLLIKGDYYTPHQSTPVTKVEKGCGIATLFSPNGTLLEKVSYLHGKPEL